MDRICSSFAAIVLGVFTTSACADDSEPPLGLPVVVDGAYDLTADFSEYRSYDLVEAEDAEAKGASVDAERPAGYIESNRIAVIQATLDELSDRGLVLDDSDPDLRITTFVRLTQGSIIEEVWWWESYWGWYWGYSLPWYSRSITELDAGTLVIDAVDIGDPDDPDDDELVFRATATGLIPTWPEDVSEHIPEVIDEMFSYWPNEEQS